MYCLIFSFHRHTLFAEMATKENPNLETKVAVKSDLLNCTHHWIIESPRGQFSDGRCKFCGDERQFRNSASDYIWDDRSSDPNITSLKVAARNDRYFD